MSEYPLTNPNPVAGDVEGTTAHGPVRYDRTDFASMSLAQLIDFFMVNGYVVMPKLIDEADIATVLDELETLPMTMATTGSRIRFSKTHPPQFHSPTFIQLGFKPRLKEFLEATLGPDIVFMLGHYLSAGGGGDFGPGLALHSDYQPYGSEAKGWDESSPATIRVLVRVTRPEEMEEPSGITFLPRSHLMLHTHADPYVKYDNHPDMLTVPADVGDATIFNVKVFHGGHPPVPRGEDSTPLNTLEWAYRPGWATCAGPVTEWTEEQLATLPDDVRPYFRPRNAGALERPEQRVDALATNRVMR